MWLRQEFINGENHHVLLSKRFDRNDEGKRIHFASALTLLGLEDGDNASTGFGYPDIVDFIIRHGSNVEQNLEELYRRVVFYIIVGNSDDHFRNHGFLLSRKGWELSPAYDINPTLQENQSLLINRSTNESDLNILLMSADDYMLSKDKAEKNIIGSGGSDEVMANRGPTSRHTSTRHRHIRSENQQMAVIRT